MNSRIIKTQFRKLDEYSFDSNEELNYHIEICNLIKCNIDEAMTITSDDVDDHNDIIKLRDEIYRIGELKNPPLTDEGAVDKNRIVEINRFRIVITQSSEYFIQITFNHRHFDKLTQQILP